MNAATVQTVARWLAIFDDPENGDAYTDSTLEEYRVKACELLALIDQQPDEPNAVDLRWLCALRQPR